MATTLTFTKVRDRYEATATVTKNYNLHIEDAGDSVSVYQRTTESGRYCMVADSMKTGDCYDMDFGNYVYPKDIKVVCDKQPSVAIITEAE